MKKKSQCRAAFTFLEMLMVIAIIVVLAGYMLPSMAGSHKSTAPRCLSNLKQQGIGFAMFASDHAGKFPMQLSTNQEGTLEYDRAAETFRHFEFITSNYVGSTKALVCPADAGRASAPSFPAMANSNLSYFVSLSARYGSNVSGGVLLGDRNLTQDEVAVRPGLYQTEARHTWGWNATNLHKTGGNLAFADGHVEWVKSTNLAGYLRVARTTNLLSVP